MSTDFFKTGCLSIKADLDVRSVAFTIENETMHVSTVEAEKYLTRIRDRKFTVIPTPSGPEMVTKIEGLLDGQPYEQEFSFPLTEIPHHTALVETALRRLHLTRN